MNRRIVSRLHRVLRVRAKLTQADIAKSAGVGRWKVVDLENGRLSRLTVEEMDACFGALDATVDLVVRYQGAAVDRLLDERHAQLVAAFVRLLRALGWETRVEVSFNEYGDRGSIDIVGWHAARRALVVVEVKSELGSVEGTLRPFDVKCRLAAAIVRKRFGWNAQTVGRILLLPEDRTVRRAVDRHAAVIDQALPVRSRELRAWLHDPAAAIGGVWFLSDDGPANTKRNPSAIRRVRRPTARLQTAGDEAPAGETPA